MNLKGTERMNASSWMGKDRSDYSIKEERKVFFWGGREGGGEEGEGREKGSGFGDKK